MPTQKQLDERINYLGGSDIPVLFGLSRFRNVHDLWLEKTGRMIPEDISDKPAVKAGKLFERGVLEEAVDVLGPIQKNIERRIKGSPIKVHADAMVRDTKEPIEVKVEGLFGKLREGWGESGSDEVPFDVLVQAMSQAMALESDIGHIGAFLGGIGFQFYRFGYDADIADQILERADRFWTVNVQGDTPPEEIPHIEFLKKTKRNPITIEIDLDLFERYQIARENLDCAEESEKQLKAEILAKMGDAEVGTAGCYRMCYKTQSRKSVDMKRLKEEKPEVVAEYMKESTFNVARFTAKKRLTKL